MSAALTRYRVMAYVVGVLLLLLVFVHIPLHYIWDIDSPIAIIHGWMFMIYVVTVIDLAMRCRWQIFPRTSTLYVRRRWNRIIESSRT